MVPVYTTLTRIEQGFNVLGAIPFVGAFSGIFRERAAKIQMVAGMAIGLMGLAGMIAGSNLFLMRTVALIGAEQLLHGIFNQIRGVTEGLLAMTRFGSLFLFALQAISYGGFSPWIPYGVFTPVSPCFELL